MTFTRLTIVGAARRADLVVPDDETFSALLPDILDLLDETSHFAGAPVRLVRRTGAQLDLSATPAELAVADGDVLRIVHAEEAPPPPEVADVTDVVADALTQRTDRWGEASRLWVGGLAVGAAAFAIGAAAPGPLGDAALVTLVGVWVVALALALVAGRMGWTWTRMWPTAIAVGVSAPLAALIAAQMSGASILTAVLLGSMLVWAALGIGVGLAARSAPPAWGALVALVASGAWLGLSYTPLSPEAVAALLGIAALVVIGLVPSLALAASGVSRLDDEAIAGELPARAAVARSLEDAYASMAWLGAALALVAGAAGIVLAGSRELYAALLAISFILILALRTRQFPLTVHVVPLYIAVLAILGAGSMSPWLPAGSGALVFGAVAVAAVLLVGVRPPAQTRVRLRRWGDILELVAVVATVPLLLGVLGVYPDLLRTFP